MFNKVLIIIPHVQILLHGMREPPVTEPQALEWHKDEET